MSQTNQHFKRLHDFIVLQLPSGFPVKIGSIQLLQRQLRAFVHSVPGYPSLDIHHYLYYLYPFTSSSSVPFPKSFPLHFIFFSSLFTSTHSILTSPPRDASVLRPCAFHRHLNLYATSTTPTEIPLFHILSARITFGNIFGMDREVPGVKVSLQQASTRPKSRTNSETKNSSQSPAMDRAVNSPPAANKMPDSGMVDIPLSSDVITSTYIIATLP